MNEVNNEIINKEEYNAAEKEAVNAVDRYTHKFSTPFKYEGNEYEELTFEFGKLTGEDCLAIENEMVMLNQPVITPEFSSGFLARMACRACTEKIGFDVLSKLPLNDFNRIKGRARSFLMK